ncbi:MAG: hypothetical protein ACSLFQ_11390, partial [Thermoanaerobaculia bacterium]
MASSRTEPAVWQDVTRRIARRLRELAFAAPLLALLASPLHAEDPPVLTASAQNQIAALLEEKASRTPAQRKIDSKILYALRMHQGRPVAQGIERLDIDVEISKRGTTIVDIRLERPSKRVVASIESSGGVVLS